MENYIKHIMKCCYTCKDYEKMKDFYNQTLELEIIKIIKFTPELIEHFKKKGFICERRVGEECMCYLAVTDDEFIVLLNVQYDEKNRTDNQGFYHVCFMVSDIIQTARELEKKGIQLWEGPSYENLPYDKPFVADIPQPCNSKVFFIQDPEGNEIEIMQFTENSLQVLHDFE